MYHYSNTLYRIGVLERRARRYHVQVSDPDVCMLIGALQPGKGKLSLAEAAAFARLVVGNSDCQDHFFGMFVGGGAPTLDSLLTQGEPVAWRWESTLDKPLVLLRSADGRTEKVLSSEEQIQAILWGVRYWARDELGFLDELYLEDEGMVMYPVVPGPPAAEPRLLPALMRMVSEGHTGAWTTLSVRQVARELGPAYHVSLMVVFATLLDLYRKYPQYTVLIPTSQSFATLTARGRLAEALQMRSYLVDEQGRLVSHVRLHRSLATVTA
ncbi:MAG: hypothetical protein ACYC5O_04050 [Anaerolineae bacterium]